MISAQYELSWYWQRNSLQTDPTLAQENTSLKRYTNKSMGTLNITTLSQLTLWDPVKQNEKKEFKKKKKDSLGKVYDFFFSSLTNSYLLRVCYGSGLMAMQRLNTNPHSEDLCLVG